MKTAMTLSILVLASACKMAPAEDSGDVNCLATCLAELRIDLADGSESFQIQIYGSEFITLNFACPDGIRAGGPARVTATCDGAGMVLSAPDFLFPTELTLSLNNGDEQVVTPDWVESGICGTQCNSADLEL
jgi:hypothetical protein